MEENTLKRPNPQYLKLSAIKTGFFWFGSSDNEEEKGNVRQELDDYKQHHKSNLAFAELALFCNHHDMGSF